LTVYFVKRVGIRDLRFYVNYAKDESYTPTKIAFKSGTSENNLIEFAQMTLDSPVGWQQVSLQGAGGGPDGNTLVSYVLQMQILENHQNGKDTHLRGIKIYAFDAESGRGGGGSGIGENSSSSNNNPVEDMVDFLDNGSVSTTTRDGGATSAQPGGSVRLSGLTRQLADTRLENGEGGFTIPDFMRDPEIR
jgi:anaphase-promoting complex subunit 10